MAAPTNSSALRSCQGFVVIARRPQGFLVIAHSLHQVCLTELARHMRNNFVLPPTPGATRFMFFFSAVLPPSACVVHERGSHP